MKLNDFTKHMKVHNNDTHIEFVEFITKILLNDKESFEYYQHVLNSIKEDDNMFSNEESLCQAIFQSGMVYGIHGILSKL